MYANTDAMRCHAVKYRHRLNAGSPRWCLPCPSPAGSASALCLCLPRSRLPGNRALPRFPLPPIRGSLAPGPRYAGTLACWYAGREKGERLAPLPSASLRLCQTLITNPLLSAFALPFVSNPNTVPPGRRNVRSSLSPSMTGQPAQRSGRRGAKTAATHPPD